MEEESSLARLRSLAALAAHATALDAWSPGLAGAPREDAILRAASCPASGAVPEPELEAPELELAPEFAVPPASVVVLLEVDLLLVKGGIVAKRLVTAGSCRHTSLATILIAPKSVVGHSVRKEYRTS